MRSDRDLLFGMLALHNHFVTREQFAKAMLAWSASPDRPFEEILRERGSLSPESYAVVDSLVQTFLARMPDQADLPTLTPVHGSDSSATAKDWPVPPLPSESNHPLLSSTREELRYRILRPHARGGLGEVFVAEDLELHREVAMKEIQPRHAHEESSRRRFLLEAEITGRLEHPGVVPVYGMGVYPDGRPYYAMRFIKGDTLRNAIQRFHASNDHFASTGFHSLLRRFLDVGNAISYAHARGVLHRDLKPANVMLGEFGETLVVDWGLAKIVGRSEPTGEETLRPTASSTPQETHAGAAVGTPAFMSPEQARGQIESLGPATDQYSLGATLYYLLTGHAPVAEGSVLEILERVRCGDILPPTLHRADVPPALAAIAIKAMSLNPGDRYPSVKALVEDLERWLADEPVTVFQDPLPVRLGRWARKHRTAVASSAAVLLVTLVSLTVGLIVYGRLNRQLESSNEDLQYVNQKLDESVKELQESNLALMKARADAERKQEEAERERKIAQAVNQFLQQDLLAQADIVNQSSPGGKVERNPNITVAELLDRAAKRIGRRFRDQPETEVALRKTIGTTYWSLGKYAQAETQLEAALALAEKHLMADHAEARAARNNLALVFMEQGKYAQTETILQELLTLEEKLGKEHASVLTTRANLAALYFKQKMYAQAEPLYLQVIRGRETVLGPDHPDTLSARNNLAVLYREQKKYSLAEPLYLEVLRQQEKRLGPDHPATWISKNNLGVLYYFQGMYDRAEPYLVEVHRQFEAKRGANHPDTLGIKNNLADLYRRLGKPEQAELFYQQAVSGAIDQLGYDNPYTQHYIKSQILFFEERDQPQKAEPILRRQIEHFTSKAGATAFSTIQARADLGLNLARQKKYPEAEKLLRDSIAQRLKSRPDSWSVPWWQSALGMILLETKRIKEAEPLLLQGYEGLKQAQPRLPVAMRKTALDVTLSRLVKFYQATGNKEAAAKWQAEQQKQKKPAMD